MKSNYKKIITLVLAFVITFFKLSAQEYQTMKLDESGGLQSVHSLENGVGFVINEKTTNPTVDYFKSEKDDIRILKYNNKFEKEWSKTLKQKYTDVNTTLKRSVIGSVSSPSGKYLYHTQIQIGSYYRKEHFIAQIDSDGNKSDYEVEGRKELGKQLQTVFCNDEYFYYLATENGKEDHDRKKKDEKLILNYFVKDDFSHSRKVLELPSVEGEEEIFWQFIGHNSSEFFVASKKVDLENNNTKVDVVVFDNTGTKLRNFTLNIALEQGFIRVAKESNPNNINWLRVRDPDYGINLQTGSTYPTLGGVTGIYFQNDHIYLAGLQGPEGSNKRNARYNGAYVIKYDLKGNLIWQKEFVNNSTVTSNKHFTRHATSSSRYFSLSVLPDGSLNLLFGVNARVAGSTFKYIISPNGTKTRFQNVDEDSKNFKTSIKLFYDDNKNHALRFTEANGLGSDNIYGFRNEFYGNMQVIYERKYTDVEIKHIYLLRQ